MSWVFVMCSTLLSSVVTGNWNFTGKNVAKGKTTEQSPGTWGKYTSDLAVDDNINTNMSAGSCTHTSFLYNTSATWTVYLNASYTLKGIRIFSRRDFKARHENFKVIGGPSDTILHDDRTANPQLYLQTKIDIAVESVEQFSSITIEVPARTNKSLDNGNSILQLCEVKIFTDEHDCPAPNSSDALVATVQTGVWNTVKGLVSTWTVLVFRCNGSFILEGNENIQCTPGGVYNTSVPTCKEILCSLPAPIVNGYYWPIRDSYSVGETVKWNCSHGYTPAQSRTRQCMLSTHWSEVQPACTRITCSFPGHLSNGKLTYHNDTLYLHGNVGSGTTIFVMCVEGFRAHVPKIKCKDDGLWDGLAVCISVHCSRLSTLTGGYYTYMLNGISVRNDQGEYKYGTVATALCIEPLYRPSVENRLSRTCGQDGHWTGHEELCDALCEASSLPNGNFSGQNDEEFYRAGHFLTPTCLDGFELDSQEPISIRCQQNHTWYPAIPSCISLKCNVSTLQPDRYFYELEASINGSIEFNNTLTANCKNGYEYNSGHKERRCLANLTLTGMELKCTALRCNMSVLQPGQYFYEIDETINGTIEFNATLKAYCKNGYEYNSGHKERRCLANQTLTGTELECTAVTSGDPSKSTAIPAEVGGGVGTVVSVMVTVVIVMFVIIRRRRVKENRPDTNSNAELRSFPAFSNDAYKEASICEIEEDTKDDSREPYYNFTDINNIPKSAIKIETLTGVVLAFDSASGRFKKEFEAIPIGMTKEHTHASQNRHRNRYRNLYAYDHTRVVLDIWDEQKDSDYINACYIHGFSRPNAYIASQGPVEDVLSDFWRMVWQKNCGKIVMLTNLMEQGKMKCVQYWPNSTTTYGSVDVTLKNMETFANFVIRTLIVSKGEEQRQVVQFHFTSWPDKDVPYFCSPFVQFRCKVNATKSSSDGPLIVHCSAGIGRTGTFIAVDYLVDEAETLGYVNVQGCVEALRRQRVNMVQTKKQYVFVHLALVEILTMKTSAVSSAKFEETYQELSAVDNVKNKRKVEIEFEVLLDILSLLSDNQINDAKAPGSKSQNRYRNILPFKEFMPSVTQPGRCEFGEYINAAFLPMHKENNALIITQSPLETTTGDFWNMVLHQGVHTIVMMNHVTELSENESYWPEVNERKTYAETVYIDNKNVERKGGHTVVTLTITTKNEERELSLIQFEKWDKGQSVPDDPGQILSALELMEENQRRTGNNPVVVHCMDGVEKSGLFCTMAAVLDRMKVEQEVAISQVIQEMRNRRQNIIPNVTQFQFCHEVVLAFLKQYETYSNFAL